jgi:ribokinase
LKKKHPASDEYSSFSVTPPDVTLFGDINIDVLMSIPDYPPAAGDAMASQVVLRPGGSVANTAIVLAKLGVRTRLIGRTGADRWAEMALEPLVAQGVDVSYVTHDEQDSTGLIFIPVTGQGERTMFSYRGANTRITPEEVDESILANPRLLHISAYNFLRSPQREATWKSINLAKKAGIPISMDVGVEPSRRAADDILAVLPDLKLVVLGLDEAETLVGAVSTRAAVDIFQTYGVKILGLKLGRKGCLAAQLGPTLEEHFLPGFSVETVDTTGAGDAFCAGMIYGMIHQLELPVSGTLANALGALATTVWGGGPALPGKIEVVELLGRNRHLSPFIDPVLQSLETTM